MTTIKIKFRSSSVCTKEGTLYYQVIHRRMVRQISTGYKLFPSEWDNRLSNIIQPLPETGRKNYLSTVAEKIEEDTMQLRKLVVAFDRQGEVYTCDAVVSAFLKRTQGDSLLVFAREVIDRLKQVGKIRTAETYTTTLNSFMRFREARDVLLGEMDSDLIIAYEAYLKSVGASPNTSSFYMRNLRAVYNRAVEKRLTIQNYPFKHVYTGIDKTVKRAVSLRVIRQIKELDLTACPSLAYARDMFLFSFFTRGMSFVDMAYLKKKNLQDGILSYRRKKTGQQLFVKWEQCMQDIVDTYDTADTSYLLAIIRRAGENERSQYKNANHLINRKLKIIGRRLGLPAPLTLYVARHAWASIARSKDIPIAVISQGMGHDSETTTRIYLTSLDTTVVDEANSLILKSL